MSTEETPGDSVRLQRLLAMAGVGSRRHCEEYITTGRVTVDGKTITALGAKVQPETQDVRLDGERIKLARRSYYAFNKPTGVLCTNRDPEGRPRVIDMFPRSNERLFTVGRLDENSQGLLIVTNDGDLAHRMAHPKFRVEKTYRVQVAGIPSREVVAQLEEGMYFSDGRFAAKSARLVKSKGQSSLLEIVLTEGQNREIRRLLAKVGHKVQRLTRIGMGPLRLGELPSGEFRRLTAGEILELHEMASGAERKERKPRSSKGGRTRGAVGKKRRSKSDDRRGPRGERKSGGSKTGPTGHRQPAKRFGGTGNKGPAAKSDIVSERRSKGAQVARADQRPAGHRQSQDSNPPKNSGSDFEVVRRRGVPAEFSSEPQPPTGGAPKFPGKKPKGRSRRDSDDDGLPEA